MAKQANSKNVIAQGEECNDAGDNGKRIKQDEQDPLVDGRLFWNGRA